MTQERSKIYTRLKGPKAAAFAGILFAVLIFISVFRLLIYRLYRKQTALLKNEG